MTSLTLRLIFRLALRQTEGLVASLLDLMDLDLEAPDHSTLVRRGKKVALPSLAASPGASVHLIIDSTGLQVSGTGPWRSDKYPKNKRQGWRKLHIGVDANGKILAHVLTDRDDGDGATGPALIDQFEVPIERLTGDRAYDCRSIYEASEKAGSAEVQVVIPPRSGAVDSGEKEGALASARCCGSRDRRFRSTTMGTRIWLPSAIPRRETELRGAPSRS